MSFIHETHDRGNVYNPMPGDTLGQGGVFPDANVPSSPRSYALSGKIMLSAIVILFTVVLLILCLHVYARWYFLRRSRLRRRSRHIRFVFTTDTHNAAAVARGLDPEVVRALPVFTYSAAMCAAGSDEPMECAVCLSEFKENEKGRTLPRCKHSFHTECIDMWFYSHATCPLCRTTVEGEPPLPVSDSVNIQIEAGTAPPQLCDSCRHEGHGSTAAVTGVSSSSFSSTTATSSCSGSNSSGGVAVIRIDVPPRRGAEAPRSLEEEVGSPGGAQGFKSQTSRMVSLKRILSIDLRFYRGGPSNEPDPERGEGADAAEERTPRTPQPPR